MSSTLSGSVSQDLTSVSTAPVKPLSSRKAIVAISLGNGLEMYDFTVYSFFAVIIGELFFNVGGSAAGLLLSLATFGVGFVMRPLGAVLIGNYADKHGRKAALTLTIALMTIGTGMIALTPTYESIGIAATVMLVASLIEWSGNKMAPAFYLMVAVAVSSLAIWRFPTRAPQQH